MVKRGDIKMPYGFSEKIMEAAEEQFSQKERTQVIKFRVEQDESGKIGYRVTKIEGFEEKKETDEEENEMQFTSTPRIYVRNENNNIILKIKSLMFTILTLEEGKIAENIRNQDDINYWKHVIEANTVYWEDTVVAYNERTPIVGSQTEMRINHRA